MKHTIVSLMLCAAIGVSAQQTDADLQQQRVVEREAYNQARRLNTVDSWDIFINNYPESFFIEQARKQRDAAVVRAYCNPQATLERLTTYIDENTAHEPRIKSFYANLVNNPTHSYRFEHMDIGFNGCTGTVDETLQIAGEKKPRHCRFVFNDQGLLTQSSIQNARGKTTVTTYEYAYDNLHGYSLSRINRAGHTENIEPFYDSLDKLEILAGDTRNKWVYSYNDAGAIAKVVVTDGDSRRTLVYNDGYIIRQESAGSVLRYLYDYDSATFKKYLIGITQIETETPQPERKFEYQIDTRGRITSVTVTQDGKTLMTIRRTYSN